MTEIKTEIFKVKNIDCPSCAAKIENGLNALDGVNDAVLDFASLTLHVKAQDIARIVDEVRKIEPDVELIPKSDKNTIHVHDAASEGIQLKRELSLLFVAATLFVIQLFFESWFHRHSFVILEIAIVVAAYLIAGWNVLLGAFKTIRKGMLFDENVLMVIATGGALAIHAYSEAVGVMIFYKVGELLQDLAVSRSRRSIRALLAAKPDKAVIKTSDGYKEVNPESVQIGDLVLIKPGEKVPLDGKILSGNSHLNSSMVDDHTEIPGQGVRARYGDHTVTVGNDSLLHLESIDHPICKFDGTVAHIAVDGSYAGYITIGDEIKPNTENAMKYHEWSGFGILVLVGFRLGWGFIGGQHSRFSSFVKGSATVVRYASCLLRKGTISQIGHNPLGG